MRIYTFGEWYGWFCMEDDPTSKSLLEWRTIKFFLSNTGSISISVFLLSSFKDTHFSLVEWNQLYIMNRSNPLPSFLQLHLSVFRMKKICQPPWIQCACITRHLISPWVLPVCESRMEINQLPSQRTLHLFLIISSCSTESASSLSTSSSFFFFFLSFFFFFFLSFLTHSWILISNILSIQFQHWNKHTHSAVDEDLWKEYASICEMFIVRLVPYLSLSA